MHIFFENDEGVTVTVNDWAFAEIEAEDSQQECATLQTAHAAKDVNVKMVI